MLKNNVLRRVIGIVLPIIVIALWLGASAIGGPYFGKISDVTEQDFSAFLPESADSTKVNEELKKFQSNESLPAVIVFSNNGAVLTTEQFSAVSKASASLQDVDGVNGTVSPAIPSEKRQAILITAPIDPERATDSVDSIRRSLDTSNLDEVTYKVTGPAGTVADISTAFEGIDGILLLTALTAVFIILIIVYRSPLLPVLVLLTSVSALSIAIFVVYMLAKAGIVAINGQVQGILFILVIGAATDYSLLYVSRFKEALTINRKSIQASIAAWKRSWEPILASGGTVIVGLLCLLVSQLSSNQALGPVGAIGIASAMLAALTFLPALLLVCRRVSFWPYMPKYGGLVKSKLKDPIASSSPIWRKLGVWTARYPKRLWIVPLFILIAASAGVLGLRSNGVSQDELILGTSEARDGQNIVSKYFPGGSGSPVYVVTPEVSIPAVVKQLDQNKFVNQISALSKTSRNGTVNLDAQGVVQPSQVGVSTEKQTVAIVDGEAVLQATLSQSSSSLEARDTIRDIRTKLNDIDPTIKVGGQTAQVLDTNDASIRDRLIIIPLILGAITIVLMILLRSILAPLLLLASTVISFTATVGISSIVFNTIFQFPGADPSVLLFAFVFLVALGIDYNIFLMTRVREESLQHGTKKGVVRGLVFTGGVITSAGLVLAATFAALAVIPILFLAQLAFIVVLGVLLDTFVVRTLIVPALIRTLGSIVWWPSKLKDKR